MSVELVVYVKIIIFLNKFYDFFCRRHSLMNHPCYNNLLKIMQYNNFQNLNRVIFTQWKHLEFRVNTFWYCFKIIKQCTFHYLMKSVPIPRNHSSFEILRLFDILRYQSLVIFFFSSVLVLILNEWDGVWRPPTPLVPKSI